MLQVSEGDIFTSSQALTAQVPLLLGEALCRFELSVVFEGLQSDLPYSKAKGAGN